MGKHTAGPWRFVADSGYSSPCLGKTQHSRKLAVTADSGTIASHVANGADARLMAAAPELLEALEGMLDTFTGAEVAPVEWQEAVAAAEAAVAKAKGEEG